MPMAKKNLKKYLELPGATEEGFACQYCKEFHKWKNKSFRPQQYHGHSKNCRENPKSRWYKDRKEKKDPTPDPQPETPPEGTELTQEPIEAEGFGGGLDVGALSSFLQRDPQTPVSPDSPATSPMFQPEVELGPDHIPPSVVAEWVLVVVSVNMDVAISYAKRKNLQKPSKLEMSSATSKWLGKMISSELGPQQSSMGLIIGALAPYLALPWLSILMQSENNPLTSIMSRFGMGNQDLDLEDDDDEDRSR